MVLSILSIKEYFILSKLTICSYELLLHKLFQFRVPIINYHQQIQFSEVILDMLTAFYDYNYNDQLKLCKKDG